MPNSEIDTGASTSRRRWLQHSATMLGLLPVMPLLGCPSTASTAAYSGTQSVSGWLTGGTARISAAVRGMQPFAADLAGACRLTCEATIGPCYTLSPKRSDISDGWEGLPLHMQIRVVNERCEPVPDALVEIWHTNHTGGYSGQIVRMCNNNQDDLNKQFFRGYQRTDKHGVVRFDSCYPGWYRGRAVHVHFRILQGRYDPSDRAASWLTSQLLFSDALNAEVFGQVPLYQTHGQPDTRLNVDNVVGKEADKSPYVFEVQNIEGVMLASKTVVVRSDPQSALCQVQGSMPPGGPGRPGGRRPSPAGRMLPPGV